MKLLNGASDVVVSSTGAPQGTVLALYTTADFKDRTGNCHLQKFSNDSAILGSVSHGYDKESISVFIDSVKWIAFTSTPPKMVIDFHRKISHHIPINIQGNDKENFEDYKYLQFS